MILTMRLNVTTAEWTIKAGSGVTMSQGSDRAHWHRDGMIGSAANGPPRKGRAWRANGRRRWCLADVTPRQLAGLSCHPNAWGHHEVAVE